MLLLYPFDVYSYQVIPAGTGEWMMFKVGNNFPNCRIPISQRFRASKRGTRTNWISSWVVLCAHPERRHRWANGIWEWKFHGGKWGKRGECLCRQIDWCSTKRAITGLHSSTYSDIPYRVRPFHNHQQPCIHSHLKPTTLGIIAIIIHYNFG